MDNIYLEKIAEAKDKKKDSIGGVQKGATAYASSVAATVASVPVIKRLGTDLDKSFDKANITEHDVKSYVKAKGLRHVKRTGGPGAYFSPHTHGIVDKINSMKGGLFTSKPSGRHKATILADSHGVAMHEYGHAHSYRSGVKALRGIKHGGYMAGGLAASPLGRLALAGAATSKDDKVSKGAIGVAAAAHVPQLVEEARASISPYKHLKKTDSVKAKHFARAAGKAYGTYAASAAATVGSAVLARALAQKARKNAEKGKK